MIKIIPEYLIYAIVSRVVFLISISDDFLVVYKNATDSCMLVLYPATLLHLSVLSFLVEIFKVFFNIEVYIIQKQLFLFFLIWMAYFVCFLLISLSRT